jgi:glycosyltransferase involved in cell wall biosynthesis
MSEYCDLTVLYGLAGPHMGDIEEIEALSRNDASIQCVKFEPILPNWLASFLNFPNRNGFLAYSFYFAYRVWHAQAHNRAKQIIASNDIDVIHYLCPIGYREPGFLWKIDKPYIWGPIGGMVPTAQLAGTKRPFKYRLKTQLKNLLNKLQISLSRRVPRALNAADVVVAATSENKLILKEKFNIDSYCFPENAIPDEWLGKPVEKKNEGGDQIVQLVWIGSLDTRKSPDLLIDAMSKLQSTNWHLHIIGDGPLASHVKKLAVDIGIALKVSFHGLVPRETVKDVLEKSALNLITSLAEGNPTVLWEAMAAGTPTISLDHNGMHDVICESCGVRVPLGSYEQTCEDFAKALDYLIQDSHRRHELQRGVLCCRENYRWSAQAKNWMNLYSAAITKHGNGRPLGLPKSSACD